MVCFGDQNHEAQCIIGCDSISFWMLHPPTGFVSAGCIACKGAPNQSDFGSLRCTRSDMVPSDQFLEQSIWDTSDTKFMKKPFSLWVIGDELGHFEVVSRSLQRGLLIEIWLVV
ncbi:hypothetical protein RDI58_029354 [Solanum bulbocastanum]|uniref:Uncharacterized protein n=1 Tax=Solanum bulbocastanum TaxID=147425 RepID=A0AAN8XZI4_SOLBU